MHSLLFQITNALRDEAKKILWHANGFEPKVSTMQLHHNTEGEYPFGSMFKIETMGPRGTTTYIVSVSETNI